MVALKALPPPPSPVHHLAQLQQRMLADLGADAVGLIRGNHAPTGAGRELLAALPVAIYTTDAEGRIAFFNEAAETLWGRRPLLGIDRYCGSWRILAGDGTPLPHDQTALAVALRTGKDVADAERVTMRPDSSQVRITPFPTLLRDASGTVTGAIVLLIDVTTSHQAAATELRESEEHRRSANALNPQMPWTADPQGRILEFSDRWCRFVGQTREEAMRIGWEPVINKEDAPRLMAAIRSSLASEEPYDIRYRVRTASGEEKWIRSRAHPRRDANGVVIRWYGTTEDIHDAVLLKEEARLAGNRHNLISQAADDVGWDMDLTNDMVIWSATLERRFGIWPEGGKSSRGWWLEHIHLDDRARVVSTIAASLAGSSDHHSAEYRFRRGDGSYAHVLDRATLIRDESGWVVRAIGAMLDRSERKSAEEALRLSEERLRATETASSLASDAAEHIAWDFDVVHDVVTWSTPLQRRFGLSPDPSESNRAWWGERIHPDDRPRMAELLNTTMAGTATRLRAEYRFRRADGSYAHVLDRGSLIRDDEGRVVRAIGAMIDLTERRSQEEALRLSEERFRLAATAAGLGVADIDTVTGAEHWSAEFRTILGVPDNALASPATYVPLIHPDDRAAVSARHHREVSGEFGEGQKTEFRIMRANDGATRWLETQRHAMRNDEGEIVRIIITNKDVTEEKTAQDRVNWAATHDAVTGLPNRSAFQARLEEALVHAEGQVEPVGLLLIDLDNFKLVNDSLGHQAGDRALAAFAARIVEAMPPGAIVVRFGGDEFAVILPRVDAIAAGAIAGVLIRNLQHPSSIGDRNIDLRASIGVAAFPGQGENATDLVQNADLALYAAKAGGGSTVRTFEPALRARLQDQLSMLSQARTALDHGWIRPFYQPKILLATGRTAGFEALLRWRDPETGLKLPATIACAFDDTELAGRIGEAMVSAVLADMKGWIARGIAVGKVAINASAAEFREPGFADRLLAKMAAFDVPPAMLELEITETAFLGDCAANVVAALETLRAAGMTIALDDFGTGFSSLSHLRNFPVDAIKIDRSFVAGLGESAEDRAIVEAVLRLGEALGMTTVAEGVETVAQADYLRVHDCTLAQGFLFAPALDAAEVPAAAETRHAAGLPPHRSKY